MPKQIAIIGLGKFGAALARELKTLGHDVIGVDKSEKAVAELESEIEHLLVFDSTSKQALEDSDIASSHIVVVAIGSGSEASILTTLLLKELGAKTVVAKASGSYHAIILKRVGADRVIQPEEEMGRRLARMLASPNTIDFIELAPGYSVVEIVPSSNMLGRTLTELDLRRRVGVNVLAIRRGDTVNAVPKGEDIVTKNDILIVAGMDEGIDNLRKL